MTKEHQRIARAARPVPLSRLSKMRRAFISARALDKQLPRVSNEPITPEAIKLLAGA